ALAGQRLADDPRDGADQDEGATQADGHGEVASKGGRQAEAHGAVVAAREGASEVGRDRAAFAWIEVIDLAVVADADEDRAAHAALPFVDEAGSDAVAADARRDEAYPLVRVARATDEARVGEGPSRATRRRRQRETEAVREVVAAPKRKIDEARRAALGGVPTQRKSAGEWRSPGQSLGVVVARLLARVGGALHPTKARSEDAVAPRRRRDEAAAATRACLVPDGPRLVAVLVDDEHVARLTAGRAIAPHGDDVAVAFGRVRALDSPEAV